MVRDLVALGVGYVVVLALFVRLGGFTGAGSAIRRWGSSSSRARGPAAPSS